MLEKIISGGQTGVDRGALDAALHCGFCCGGWCPAGRKAEDGCIPERYPLRSLKSEQYQKRTLKNVLSSDGTLLLYHEQLKGGTKKTLQYCQQHSKPSLCIDCAATDFNDSVLQLQNFVDQNQIKILNVAGPRLSHWPGSQAAAFQLIEAYLQSLTAQG
ncbi:putative molybdenum carrier protein [Kaarinaea lacus]